MELLSSIANLLLMIFLAYSVWEQSKTLKAYRKRNMELEHQNSVLKAQLDELFNKMEK